MKTFARGTAVPAVLLALHATLFGQDRPDAISLDDAKAVTGDTVMNLPLPTAPQGLVTRVGDRSVVLHWVRNREPNLVGYYVYRASAAEAPFTRLTTAPVTLQGYADLDVTNGQTGFYCVRAVDASHRESANSATVSATPRAFTDDNDFLEYVQQTAFDYFWFEANPVNGLVPDRSASGAPCSVAAVGFGLTAIGIGIDHGWITRSEGRDRVLATLRTFWEKPQGPQPTSTIGHKGWFYHFLEMATATRAGTSELSSVDTALFLAGAVYAKQYFDRTDPDETAIRRLVDALCNRIDWLWMAKGQYSLTMGWRPESGFISARWIGYNEAMILYVLGLGTETNPLPPVHWDSWTSGYEWGTHYGYSFVTFPPLFGHQFSHCWIDFRDIADKPMRDRGLTYFENSRRATLAQRAYAVANPGKLTGYGENVWGFTACDGPGTGNYLAYSARGAPPPMNDDGTIAPTAIAGSMPFAPEYALAALRHIYDAYRPQIWTAYGFRDAFNLQAGWWGPDVLGIDQGPMVIMIENYRTQGVWRRFMQNPEIQRGLRRAGFTRSSP